MLSQMRRYLGDNTSLGLGNEITEISLKERKTTQLAFPSDRGRFIISLVFILFALIL